ncbi:MAG: phytanoyl-CoA dioxygenase family protein [Paracoccaceae bacterium]
MPLERLPHYQGYFSQQDCSTEPFLSLISETLPLADLNFASAVEKNIPIYDSRIVDDILRSSSRQDLLAEWAYVLGERSGIVVLKQAMVDLEAVDEASEIFNDIIAEERQTSSGGDHFGERGANDRIWNSLQKLCLKNPSVFARYFSSPSIAAISEAWLGPWSQMTTQVNLVRPGGKPQTCHRDYHLGFMPPEQATRFPTHAHLFSGALTLQGAIAHCDMPIESGPTKLLPNSQRFAPGYIAAQMDSFREIFEAHYVQLALEKGDALFFSPALFHAAGENRSRDIDRMVNLLQVSSAMGRSLERIDRRAMVSALFPALKNLNLPQEHLASVIAASAEGYPFPTNLDTDPPIGGLASESQAGLLKRALGENMSDAELESALGENFDRRQP